MWYDSNMGRAVAQSRGGRSGLAGPSRRLGRGHVLGVAMLALITLMAPRTAVALDTGYEFSFPNGLGGEVQLKRFYGEVVLVVNVATRDGQVGQMRNLQALQNVYANRGFHVVAVPCNDFLRSAPEMDVLIQDLFTRYYNVEFPITGKVSVRGPQRHPFYTWVSKTQGGDVRWNFDKVLLGPDGQVTARFSTEVMPQDLRVLAAIGAALDQR